MRSESKNFSSLMRLLLRLFAPFAEVFAHRDLIIELSRREVLGRYRGAYFGLLWSLLSPFLLLCVYTFAFGKVMGGRWPEVESGDVSFSIVLFVGLLVHGLFAECFNRAPLLVLSNPTYVKRMIFPLQILPWSMILSALFHVAMNAVVFVLLRLVMDGDFVWTVVLLPLVLFPLVILTAGVSWFFASIGVFFRDIAQITGVLSMALLFLSSAMMPTAAVPEAYRFLFRWNPLTPIIDQAREVMLWGRLPNWEVLGAYLLVAVLVAWLGHAWFSFTRKGFSDVL